jgi:hypothetical protein
VSSEDPVRTTLEQSREFQFRAPAPAPTSAGPSSLADILERVLDKGIVIAGDIQINLLEIELLTIKIRLLVASVDRAKEMGINWWESDSSLNTTTKELKDENQTLRERLERLEEMVVPAGGERLELLEEQTAGGSGTSGRKSAAGRRSDQALRERLERLERMVVPAGAERLERLEERSGVSGEPKRGRPARGQGDKES